MVILLFIPLVAHFIVGSWPWIFYRDCCCLTSVRSRLMHKKRAPCGSRPHLVNTSSQLETFSSRQHAAVVLLGLFTSRAGSARTRTDRCRENGPVVPRPPRRTPLPSSEQIKMQNCPVTLEQGDAGARKAAMFILRPRTTIAAAITI